MLNPLAVVGDFLATHPDMRVSELQDLSKEYLLNWAREKGQSGNTVSYEDIHGASADLIVDCLLAVGIGPSFPSGTILATAEYWSDKCPE